MNTSTHTNQIHHFVRRAVAGALLGAAFGATALGLAATSHADAAPNLGSPAPAGTICKTEPFGFLGSQRRTLCDGPIAADGSWSRQRTIWAPARYTTQTCIGSSHSSYTDCYGGYYTPDRLISDETYPVRPETVLPDEPGHLG